MLDKLVSVHTLAGGEQWVLLHLEVQGAHDADFAERMFVYNYRVYDRYRRAVASMALLRLEAADVGLLTQWAKNFVHAQTLDAVFGPE